MKKLLSDQIKIASLLCTFMVIMRHSRNLQAFWGTEAGNRISVFVENGFSVLTEIAVPYFFLVSGFFFFRTNYYRNRAYCAMLKKKIHTLVIPFLIWNVVWAVFLYAVGFMDWHESWIEKLQHLFQSDYYGALWFVKSLIIFMLLVPVYEWIFVVNNKYLYLLIGLFLLLWWWPVDCSLFSTEGMFFFFIGGVVQRYNKVIEWSLPKWMVVTFFFLWVVICFAHPWWSIPTHKLTTLFGIIIFWLSLKYLPKILSVWLLKMCPMTFFIYVNHFWVVKGMKVMTAQYYPQNEAVTILVYFLLPFVTFVALWLVGRQWNKLSPKSYGICVGGRG